MQQPLVSIVITLWNGEKFIARAIESCLHQTYKNIEVVILDDVSTDNTEAIIKEYAEKDQRIKFFKNEANIGYTRSLAKLPELASGTYAQLLGADDWLARNYIETVVRHFEMSPKAACVAAKIVTVEQMPDNHFLFMNAFLPKGTHISKKFYLRHVYKTELGATFTPLALFRKSDFLESAGFIEDVSFGLPLSASEEMKRIYSKGHLTGTLFLLKVIHKYPYIAITGKTAYIKTQHFENENKPHNTVIDWTSAGRVLRSYYFDRVGYEHLFGAIYRDFYKGFRLFFGADPFVSMFFVFIKKGFPRSFFTDLKREDIKLYFADYSFVEKLSTFFYFPLRFTARLFSFFMRLFYVSRRSPMNIFQANYFLGNDGYFSSK